MQELEGVKEVVRESFPAGIRSKGLTKEGIQFCSNLLCYLMRKGSYTCIPCSFSVVDWKLFGLFCANSDMMMI
jgi:hypothetical protein